MVNVISTLYGIALILELFALLLVGRLIYNSTKRFRRHPVTKDRLRAGMFTRDILMGMSSLIIFVFGLAVLNFAMFLQCYRVFAMGEPVARVIITPSDAKNEFSVQIQELGQPLSKHVSPDFRDYFIKGDKWTVEGNIIRFHPALNLLGFRPVYELTRIQGGYFSIDDELKKERTVYSMVDRTSENWWEWMYKSAETMPFVDLVYGSAVSNRGDESSQYIITVSPSGLSLEKVDK